MAEQREARRHHYVPRMYLRNFVGDDGLLAVIDRRWGGLKRKSPDSVFWQRDYYRVEGGEDVPPTAFETAFSKLENKAAPVIRDILATGTLPSHGSGRYGILMSFVALQAMRGPHARRRLAEPRRALRPVLEHGEQVQKHFGQPGQRSETLESLRRYVEHQPTTEDHVRDLLGAADVILQPLAARKWSLLCAPDGVEFITSDTPVALEWTSAAEEHRPFLSPGYAVPGTDVVIPLGSEVLLYGCFEGIPPLGTLFSREQVAIANFRTLRHAVRFAAARCDEIVWRRGGSAIEGTEQLRRIWRESPVRPEEDLAAPEPKASEE